MSMKAWAAALFAGATIWAWLVNMLVMPNFSASTMGFQLGSIIPFVATLLIPSGVVALITRAISKNGVTAMKTWWVLSILIAAFFTFGAVLVRWPLILW